MIDCDNLIDALDNDARSHIRLALLAEAPPVAEMHLDLALFSKTQARIAEALCND